MKEEAKSQSLGTDKQLGKMVPNLVVRFTFKVMGYLK